MHSASFILSHYLIGTRVLHKYTIDSEAVQVWPLLLHYAPASTWYQLPVSVEHHLSNTHIHWVSHKVVVLTTYIIVVSSCLLFVYVDTIFIWNSQMYLGETT